MAKGYQTLLHLAKTWTTQWFTSNKAVCLLHECYFLFFLYSELCEAIVQMCLFSLASSYHSAEFGSKCVGDILLNVK